MSYRHVMRRRFNLLPKEPFQLAPKTVKNPYLKALYRFLPTFNLKHVNRIDYAFDPFHEKSTSIRNVMFQISNIKVRASNPKCAIRSSILTDRSDPTIRMELANGQQLIYNTSNLTELEILQHIHKTKSVLDVEPETVPARK